MAQGTFYPKFPMSVGLSTAECCGRLSRFLVACNMPEYLETLAVRAAFNRFNEGEQVVQQILFKYGMPRAETSMRFVNL